MPSTVRVPELGAFMAPMIDNRVDTWVRTGTRDETRKKVAEELMKRLEAEKPSAGQSGTISGEQQERWQKLSPVVVASNLGRPGEAVQITTLGALAVDEIDMLTLVLVGSSGSGKTTLLTLLSGLDHPTSGQVVLDGRNITDATEDQLAPLRNRLIGFVFQSFHLVPSMTALENIMFPAEINGDPNAKVRAAELLAQVGLSDRSGNLPSQLSGGEKQRVALCRALINRPKLLFADEPTGNLDSENGQAVFDQMVALKDDYGATLVLVTHNPDIARAADRVLTLKDGCIGPMG